MIIPADAVVFDQNGLHVAVVENGHGPSAEDHDCA